MNQFEMVVMIVGIVMLASVIRAKYGYGRRRDRQGIAQAPQEQAETMRLKDEVKQLKERLHVLERIVTDQPSKLAQEIDRLAIDKGGRA